MKCIIPCAGESSRMAYVPKHMVTIGGKPLLFHIMDTWRDSVDSFIFVLKRSMAYMWEYLPDNSAVVFQDEPKGLADAILRAEPYVNGRFVVALGDCLFKGEFDEIECDLGIGVWVTAIPKLLETGELYKNYLVETRGGIVTHLKEKPTDLKAVGYCGMGVYFLDERVFGYIRSTKVKQGGGDLTMVLQAMVDAGEKLSAVLFHGNYINIGRPEDIMVAERMLNGK